MLRPPRSSHTKVHVITVAAIRRRTKQQSAVMYTIRFTDAITTTAAETYSAVLYVVFV